MNGGLAQVYTLGSLLANFLKVTLPQKATVFYATLSNPRSSASSNAARSDFPQPIRDASGTKTRCRSASNHPALLAVVARAGCLVFSIGRIAATPPEL